MKPGGVDDRRLRGGVRGGGGAAGASRADVTLGPLRKLTKAQAVDALVKCAPPIALNLVDGRRARHVRRA